MKRAIVVALFLLSFHASAQAVTADCTLPFDQAKPGVGCRYVTDPIPGATTADVCELWVVGGSRVDSKAYVGGTVVSRGDTGAPPAGTLIPVGCVWFVVSADGVTTTFSANWLQTSTGSTSPRSNSVVVTSKKALPPLAAPTNLRIAQ